MMGAVTDIGFLTPRTLAEALQLLQKEGGAVRILAGGTDAMVWQHTGAAPLPRAYLSIWGIPGLSGVRQAAGHLDIGALSTFADLQQSEEVARYFPSLLEASRQIGAVQIQNRATLGGNVMNASPAGDSLPPLLTLGATAVLESAARGERRVPFEALYRGYRLTVRAEDELLTRIELPLPSGRTWSGFEKVGSRRAQTISKVMAALRVTLDAEGQMQDVALAFGSVAPTVLRVPRTERLLERKVPAASLADQVASTLSEEISPITDLRSDAEYRRFAAIGLVRRLLRRLASA